MGKHAIEIVRFLPYEHGYGHSTLLCFASIRVKELRLIILALLCTRRVRAMGAIAFEADAQGWRVIHEPDGRIRYAKILEFKSPEVRRAFNAAVLNAYDNYQQRHEEPAG